MFCVCKRVQRSAAATLGPRQQQQQLAAGFDSARLGAAAAKIPPYKADGFEMKELEELSALQVWTQLYKVLHP